MDNRTNKESSDAPFANGGAVDDLTPPTMKGVLPSQNGDVANGDSALDLPQTINSARPTELERTMVGTPQTLPAKKEKSAAHSSAGNYSNQHVATIFGDIPTQDLSNEQLLRDAPRLESGGVICPSLNGIPLVYKLGQGGMGAVYYGVHPRLRSEVAVKVLPFHLAAQDPGMIQRFFREAQIAAKVRSPHLVSVIDVNEESGLFFLVMEYVAGCSMGQYLKKEIEAGRVGLPEVDAIDACIAASMGLDAAHQYGIIHRDLKPDNIMCPYKSRQHKTFDIKSSKLMDLGLARSEEGNQSLTGVQAAMGTPGYMAPEQALDAKTADKRSDVFGMGATLYALLAGRPPFKGDVVMKVLMATMHEPHPPISQFRPDVSPALSDVIDRCLDKRPENRFADARHLIRALKSCRKILAPDSSFGGEDEGDSYDDSGASKSTPHPAPKIAGSNILTRTLNTLPRKKSALPFYAALSVAAMACILLVAYVVKLVSAPSIDSGKTTQVVEVLQPIDEDIKKLIVESHNQSIQAAYEFIRLQKFREAEFKYQTAASNDAQYTKQIPTLVADLDKLRKDIQIAKKGDEFENVGIAIDMALQKKDVDQAKKLSEKWDPATPIQIEERNKKLGEIIKTEKKLKNKDEFTREMLESGSEKLNIEERLQHVTRALELIPEEPGAMESQRMLKEIQKRGLDEEEFKRSMASAKDLFVQHNYGAAYKAVLVATQLKSDNKDALEWKQKILDSADGVLKQTLQAQSQKAALTAFEKSKEFYANKDAVQALEMINTALANVPNDDAYILHKKRVQELKREQDRLAELIRKKAAFQDYYKEAKDNLEYATDVKKAATLELALQRINVAKDLKLEDPNLLNPADPNAGEELKKMVASLNDLEVQVLARQSDLKTRKQFDDWLVEAATILDENGIDGKLAGIETGINKVDDALKILAAGKVVTPKEGAVAEELKKKLEAKKQEIVIREEKRAQVAEFLAQGDSLLKKGNFAEARQAFKKAEPVAGDLSIAERNAVQGKIHDADTKIANLKIIDGLVREADKLAADEKFDAALVTLDRAEKVMSDGRVAPKKVDVAEKKAALDKLVQTEFNSDTAMLGSGKVTNAVESLKKLTDAHPSRSDLAAAVKAFMDVQRIDNDISVKLPDLKSRFANAVSRLGERNASDRARATEAFDALPKLVPNVARHLAESGMSAAATEAAALAKSEDDLLNQARNVVIILEGIIRDEERRQREAQKPPAAEKPQGRPPGGEVVPGDL